MRVYSDDTGSSLACNFLVIYVSWSRHLISVICCSYCVYREHSSWVTPGFLFRSGPGRFSELKLFFHVFGLVFKYEIFSVKTVTVESDGNIPSLQLAESLLFQDLCHLLILSVCRPSRSLSSFCYSSLRSFISPSITVLIFSALSHCFNRLCVTASVGGLLCSIPVPRLSDHSVSQLVLPPSPPFSLHG